MHSPQEPDQARSPVRRDIVVSAGAELVVRNIGKVGAAAAGVTVGMIAFGVWQAWWIAALLLAAAGWRMVTSAADRGAAPCA